MIGIAPGAEHVPFKIDRVRVVRGDRENPDDVPVEDLEGLKLLVDVRRTGRAVDVQAQHRPLLMSLDALDLDVAQGRSGKYSAGKFENLRQRFLAVKFVDGRP